MVGMNFFREQIHQAIQEFRDNQPNKKLSGKTVEMLENGVDQILSRKFFVNTHQSRVNNSYLLERYKNK